MGLDRATVTGSQPWTLAHLLALLDPGAWQGGDFCVKGEEAASVTLGSVGAETTKACGLYMVFLPLMRPWLLP